MPVAAQASQRRPRAWVAAVQQTQASGEVLVSLTSNARKVTVTFRTAKNKKRSATIRIRAGQGAKSLPVGSHRVFAQARSTSKLRASRKVAVSPAPATPAPATPAPALPAPAPAPASTAGQPNMWQVDADGNGTLDYYVDIESDGTVDAVLLDVNGNGRFEHVVVYSPYATGLFVDQNEDGYFELVGLDADRNGLLEVVFYDADGDRFPEQQALDLIGPDGVADTWVYTATATGTQDANRMANDLMIRNNSMFAVMRPFNPWAVGYVTYDPTPTLDRVGASPTTVF
jgi:hypothetical protein